MTVYLAAPNFFKPASQDWTFLLRFCDSFSNESVTDVD